MKVTIFSLLSQLQYVEPILCGLLVYFLVRANAVRQFLYLFALLCVRLGCSFICIALLTFCGRVIERHLAYQIYFYVYWTSFALEAILSLLVTLAAGLMPALDAGAVDLRTALTEAGGRGVAGSRRRWFRRLLVGGEIALAVLLIASANAGRNVDATA